MLARPLNALLLLLVLSLAACVTPQPEGQIDLIAEAALDQEDAFDQVVASLRGLPDVIVELEDRPKSFQVRRHGQVHSQVVVSTLGTTTRVRTRTWARNENAAELRRWLQLAFGDKLVGINELPVVFPRAQVAAPTSTSTAPVRSSGGTVYVRGYYRKDGTYVRPHTRRK